MPSTQKIVTTLGALTIFFVGILLGTRIDDALPYTGDSAEIRKLEDAYSKMARFYVENLDDDVVVESGIEGMLEALDPHSSYIPASVAQELQEEYEGSFGGVGLWYEVISDTARVSSTIEGGPSEAVGVRAGDRIVAVEGQNVTGDSLHLVQKLLKGPSGTRVAMTVLRRGLDDTITFDITRAIVPIYTVPAALMLDDHTGYIKISQFSMTTDEEFNEKLMQLKSVGMENLILDLRNNPGGIMESAVNIADQFLPAERTIVQTKGRRSVQIRTEKATDGGLFESGKVAVLVNEFSASASEIIAGALQDNDRAIVVGRRTFGKALVQQEFALPDGSLLHLTVSRYYTPSGRLIQTPYEDGNHENYLASKVDARNGSTDVMSLPDSLRYETIGGRPVAGDGGILPDVVVASMGDDDSEWTSLLRRIVQQSIDVSFVNSWFQRREADLRNQWSDDIESFDRNFRFDEEFWRSFRSFYAEQTGSTPAPGTWTEDTDLLNDLLKARLAQQLFGTRGWFHFYTRVDPVINQTLRLWPEWDVLLGLSEN